MNKEQTTRCGYAAVVGRPNVGKSTLLNRILGAKLSIVTPKPQTTRNRILAVHNLEGAQVVFLDTPGIHTPRDPLGRYMVEAAEAAIQEADVCLWLLDASGSGRKGGLTRDEREMAGRFEGLRGPVLCVVNKIDLMRDKAGLLPIIQDAAAIPSVETVVPLSALTGDGVDILLAEIVSRLPEAPFLFPADMLSDRDDRFFVAELVREALTDMTRQEIPYAAAVVVDRYVEESDRCLIHATIHVERPSQKGIVVGKGGHMIRDIGTKARAEAERLLGCPVELRLHVDVSPGWSEGEAGMKRMGYE